MEAGATGAVKIGKEHGVTAVFVVKRGIQMPPGTADAAAFREDAEDHVVVFKHRRPGEIQGTARKPLYEGGVRAVADDVLAEDTRILALEKDLVGGGGGEAESILLSVNGSRKYKRLPI